MFKIYYKIICIFLFAVFVVGCKQSIEFNTISKYLDYDLRNLNSQSAMHFQNLLKEKLPEKNLKENLKPWYVWKIENSENEECFVLFSVSSLKEIPGNAYINIDIFDFDFNYSNSKYFSVGNRMDIRKANLYHTKFGATIIQVGLSYLCSKNIIMRQYYGFVENKIALIRAEDSKNNMVRLEYAWGHPFGPKIDKCNIDVLESHLKSKNELDILKVLVWLSGVHADLSKMKTSVAHEKKESVECFEELYKRASSQKILDKLSHSDNRWIREAASLTKTKEYDWIIDG